MPWNQADVPLFLESFPKRPRMWSKASQFGEDLMGTFLHRWIDSQERLARGWQEVYFFFCPHTIIHPAKSALVGCWVSHWQEKKKESQRRMWFLGFCWQMMIIIHQLKGDNNTPTCPPIGWGWFACTCLLEFKIYLFWNLGMSNEFCNKFLCDRLLVLQKKKKLQKMKIT
jgi:hypothetical protein